MTPSVVRNERSLLVASPRRADVSPASMIVPRNSDLPPVPLPKGKGRTDALSLPLFLGGGLGRGALDRAGHYLRPGPRLPPNGLPPLAAAVLGSIVCVMTCSPSLTPLVISVVSL